MATPTKCRDGLWEDADDYWTLRAPENYRILKTDYNSFRVPGTFRDRDEYIPLKYILPLELLL